ncbi:hypothetical protein [Mycolicibacterium aichiense]|uniref:Holin n=1 Tax=Mycolicibacterium aichiense TaxID=1799 RepID=A0AAD1HPZ0_9MYCO|nr:hypothetical protein [Mycolicibacterium aichiense]MCV7016730.1 hypothetical protein [Mycolicibacterium aichiense]QFG07979.1 holin [Mycobacterium phage Herbertwm]BBX09487.1 hypothetical protein MAIC_42900 [Mycolicibacterium aichiense]SUA14052.1 Uncharacterised protein [Mycolicibacterium aichiense]
MKYSIPTIAKAVMAVITATLGAAALAAHGPDLSVLTFGEWMGALGAGLTSGGVVFGTPNRDSKSAAERVAQGVQDALVKQAQSNSDVEQIRQVIAGAVGNVPVFGPLASQILNQFPTAYSQAAVNQDPYLAPYDR